MLCLNLSAQAGSPTDALIQSLQQMIQGEYNEKTLAFYLGQSIDRYTDSHGRVTRELQEVLYWLEREAIETAPLDTQKEFQRIVARVGGKVRGKILIPEDKFPFWLRDLHLAADSKLMSRLREAGNSDEIMAQFPFAEFHSQKSLSTEADVVIVGAGLTGANVMFFLLDAIRKGLRVIVIDSNLADSASFRNGGNFEAMPESFLGDYEGLREERVKYLRLTRPYMNEDEIQKMATHQAEWILKWCTANVQHVMDHYQKDGIEAFANPKGWLRMAETAAEEAALRAEVESAQGLGLEFEYWSKERIQEELKIPAKFGGRMALKSGNYHPGRLVTQLLQKGLEAGAEMHLGTRVLSQKKVAGGYEIKTSFGTVKTKHLVAGTNAFTRDLIPELAPVIHPFQSHIANWEHVRLPSKSPAASATWTWNLGDGYGHFRWETIYANGKFENRGMFHIGGGRDIPANSTRISELNRDPEVFESIVANINEKLPETQGQPPTRFWTGLMGFTPDRFPLVGALDTNFWIAAGYNGYGGSWSLHAAYEIAQMIQNGKGSELYNENYLSPHRFFNGSALNPLGRAFANDDPCAVALAKKKE